jgi:hypothetical protein
MWGGMSGQRVHVRDADGALLYNRLTDDGTGLLRFEVYGFVTVDTCRRNRWQICDGWPA